MHPLGKSRDLLLNLEHSPRTDGHTPGAGCRVRQPPATGPPGRCPNYPPLVGWQQGGYLPVVPPLQVLWGYIQFRSWPYQPPAPPPRRTPLCATLALASKS